MSSNYGFYHYSVRRTVANVAEKTRKPDPIPSSSNPQPLKKIAPTVFSQALANSQNVFTPFVPTQFMADATKECVSSLAKKFCIPPQPKKDYPSEDAIKNDIYSGNR
jgi:hypothetical protein